jgi:leucyl aminopeptidase (aminopeptidase T)
MNLSRKLRPAAETVIHECLAVTKNERVAVITDQPCREVGWALWEALQDFTEAVLVEMNPREIHGMEPPRLVTDILKGSDVFVIPTSRSLTHTRARINACKAGARGATMPGITSDIMIRTLNADYHRIARLTDRLTRRLSSAKKVRITTELGTDLELDITGRKGDPDTGIVTRPGSFSNLPAGESYVAPIENRSRGRVVVDGSFAPIGRLKRPVTIDIRNGMITRIQGHKGLADIFRKYGPPERTLGELGMGTNYQAVISGNVLEDEKVMGTIHVAFGNNLGFGGKNKADIHLDGIVKRPNVWFDGDLIIEKGRLRF